MKLDGYLRAHAFMHVERPPELWVPCSPTRVAWSEGLLTALLPRLVQTERNR